MTRDRVGDAASGIDRRTLGVLGASALMLGAGRVMAAGGEGFAKARVEWRADPVGIDTRHPRFRWTLTSPVGAHDVRQTGFRLCVIGGVGSGEEGRTLFDSGWRTRSETGFMPDRPLPLRHHAAYIWHLAVSTGDDRRRAPIPAGRFVTGLLDPEAWSARWISDGADFRDASPALEGRRPMKAAQRMPLLRGQFDEARPVVAAFLSIAGLGQYTLSINGQAVGSGEIRSGWTDYRKRVLYDTFDVTALIKPGRTVLGVMLGNGFFNVEGVEGRYAKLVGSFGRPKLIAQLRLVFADGGERIVATGEDWQVGSGPVTFSSIFGGEDEDARLTPQGWDRLDQVPEGFVPATGVASPGGRLKACPIASLAVMERYDKPRFSEPRPSVLVADLGRNFAGRPAVTFRGLKAGQMVAIKPGEVLMADGAIDQRSMTGTGDGYNGIGFFYTADDAATQVFRPRFTYTGFRYLQFEGVSRDQIADLVGEFIHLDTPRVGAFRCSEPRLEAIHGLIEQAMRSNLVSVVSDCPHREKLGWLEQIYLNAGTVFYNRDAIALYEKMADDIGDAQLPGGMAPSIAPEFVAFVTGDGQSTMFRDTPEWGCAVVLAAWEAYRFHGDDVILRRGWPHMQAYAGHLAARAVDGVLDYGLGDWYDIGPRRPGEAQLTTKAFTGTATWRAVLTTLARIADLLGDETAAKAYRAGALRVRDTINARFLDRATGRYDRGSQTAQAMSLCLDIVPDDLRARTLDLLIADIRTRDDHVTAGDVGFHYVVRALTQARRSEVLQAMMLRGDRPSYGHQLAQGATALTEAWDADRRSSQNHFMLGHIESWFYGGVGGIRMAFGEEGPPIVVAPQLPPGVTWADVSYDSVLGEIRCIWRLSGEGCRIEVTIPAGATARLRLPARHDDVIRGITSRMHPTRELDDDGVWLVVGSGRHRFDLAVTRGSQGKRPRSAVTAKGWLCLLGALGPGFASTWACARARAPSTPERSPRAG